jgi:CheY-like chemotaxis protein
LLDGFLVKPVTPSMLFDAIVDAGLGQGPSRPPRPAPAAGAQRLAGLRLLVAEDNLNNQQVVRELLEDEGASVQIAANGKEAVEAVAAAEPPFDLVLMDLQMPVMDGFTATRTIREDLALPALPIVAMTANAMASDREACLAAGMNDHIGKPFDLNHLVQVLRAQTGRGDGPAVPAGLAPALETLPGAVRDAAAAAGVRMEAALGRLGGKADVYRQMLQRFVNDLAGWPAELKTAGASSDTPAAARLLHTLKGVAATLGADSLAAEAARCEKQLHPGCTPADARQAVVRACAAIEAAALPLHALLQALRPAEPVPPASAGTAIDHNALRLGLRQLAELLRNSDMAALQALAGLQAEVPGALGERFQALGAAINGLDFDPALRHCTHLLEALES